MGTAKKSTADLQSMADSIFRSGNEDFISMTNILEAMDGEFFISDWLRSCNTGEFPAIRGSAFNYGEFAIIKRKAGISSHKISSHDFHPGIFFKLDMCFRPEFKPVEFNVIRIEIEVQA
ncbi:hypothetical protein [Pelodictyon phaeoclathratiforme]|jgi:hypothetical protein|uniref:Uncharacterized protein n=1 Tax=Pelodictyon phaeoclathratiforme (strain DSM 5477 / BU-1) TaxID=324925 RepID=B4SAF6_PELPB|nr:hypothetical protein [Pelodictyon phaeoclathratiforme]ACF43842.1 hypothetical protein Ppha_1602 [Pelodictyon phaeoclathratiforme BU-1]